MAEQKGGPEDVEESHGEFLGLRNIDDSGIESGEDLKGVNPEVMKEVEEALVRLECILPGLDVSRREAVSKLVNSLQSCLKLPPRRRITIGVSPGELAAARKWLKPPLEELIIEHVNYCPVLQRPGYLMEPAPQQAVLSYIPKTDRSLSDSGSLQDYDPSLRLFTPEQTVQIAIHKAAIKKQISQEGKRRESSDDGDVSSGEESCEVNNYNEVSSAQRLLQIATESAKKNPSAARFHNRSSKKLKMKRANTIDIPKPANFFEYSSGDEYGASADEVSIDVERKHHKEIKFLPPTFEPKTENDLKFLAFLKQVNENQPKMKTYNPSARGGKHWSNRFSSIKTAFEHSEQPKMSVPSPAKMFWQNSEAHQNNEYKDQYKNKLPWTVKTGDNGVVVGSLTVAKPGHVNNFNHAPKSAFKPIEKKPVSTVSGTVKQIAAQKFSVSDSEMEKIPEKNIKKQTNESNPHMNYTPNTKQNSFVNNTFSAFKKYNSSPQSNNNEKPHSKITTHPATDSNYTSFKSFDTSNINNEKYINFQKHNITQNKTSLSNLQSNIKSYQYNTSTQPYTNSAFPSKTQQNTLAAKKQFMQVSSNSTPQNSVYKPSTHITNHQDNNNHGFGHSFPPSYGYQPSSCSSEFHNNDYQKSSQNVLPKKNDYKISYQVSNPSNNGYQISSYSKNQAQSILHSSNDGAPQNVALKSISKNINGPSNRYSYNSNVNPNTYSDEDYKHSPTIHSEKDNFRIENNDDFSILGDNKPKNDIYSSTSGYSNFPENSDNIFKQNNYIDPSHFKNKPYTAYIYSSNNTVNSADSFDQRTDLPLISTDKPNHVTQAINDSPLLIKEELPPSSPYSLSVSSSLDRMSPQRISTIKFPDDNRYLSPSYQSMSPSLRIEEDESPWGSVTNGDDSPLEEKAVSRVMGQAQCQQAVTVNNRTRRRFDLDLESELKLQVRQSAQKKSLSPSFPNVIQKSESWHQMVKEQMQQAKQAPPLPKISKAKSSHTLALPKQYEAALSQETLTQKKITVSQYLSKQSSRATKSTKTNPKYKSTNTINIQQEDDDLADVDEVFESIFQESNKKRNSK